MTIISALVLAAVLSPPEDRQPAHGPYLVGLGSQYNGPLSLRMPVPGPWAFAMNAHIGSILAHRWAVDLNSRDLDHGHLLYKPGWTCQLPCTPERVMEGVAAVVYHSAENADRWAIQGARGIPVDSRTHRSIIGWSDRSVQPAVQLVWSQRRALAWYDSNGTVTAEDLSKRRPDLFRYIPAMPARADVPGGSLDCQLSNYVAILQDSDGRFHFSNGRGYDFLLVCLAPSGTLN